MLGPYDIILKVYHFIIFPLKLYSNITKVAQEKIKINKVAFDRNGYPYHGRIKALADAARESGLEF